MTPTEEEKYDTGIAFDNAKVLLVETINDMRKVLEVHYTAAFQDDYATVRAAGDAYSLASQALRLATIDYKVAYHEYRQFTHPEEYE